MSVSRHRSSGSAAPSTVLHRSRAVFLAAIALVLAVVGGGLSAAPAFAATAALTVAKTVEGVETGEFDPGDEFTYTITVGCDDDDCLNAELVDVLPTELAGFEILSTSVEPPSQPAVLTLTGCSDEVTAECAVSVRFEQAIDGGVGIRAGDTYQVSLTLKTPQDLPPTWGPNGATIVNTAVATADTADTVSDPASVVITVPTTIDVEVAKRWTPASQQFSPGVDSTIALDVRNASNIDAETLTVQDPASADDGAAELAADNPFRIVDFTGFGAVTAPQGADLVTVDAYTYNAGSWTWVTGTATSIGAIALPDGVSAGDVGGLRIIFSSSTGTSIVADGTAGTVELGVEQRASDRETEQSLVLGASVDNVVRATVDTGSGDPVSKTAEAPYEIGSLDTEVLASKTISPARMPAGSTADATIGARNDSNGPLTRLVLSDEDYFTEDVTFGGFEPIAFPSGATSATITWTYSDGSILEDTVDVDDTPAPADAPSGAYLTGFSIAFEGAIAAGATVSLGFGIAVAVDAVADEDSDPLVADNTVVVTGENTAGTATDDATAPLDVFYPSIDLELEKTISPTGAVAAGGTVVVQTPATTGTDSAFVSPSRIVIDDVWRDELETDFWNAFSPIAIAPTQVPSGSTMTVQFSTDAGATWTTLVVVDATEGTQLFSGSIADIAAAEGVTVDPSDITGLRYAFDDSDGFAAGVTVSPNTVFQARSTLRSDASAGTSIPNADPSEYENRASATAEGIVDGGTTISSDEVEDVAVGSIVSYEGAGTLLASKRFVAPGGTSNLDFVNAQSGESAGTLLGWGVAATGYSSVVIADPNGQEATPEDTVFQAFDLTRIAPISFQRDPLLRWDTVSTIELYSSGAWHTVAAPGGSWMNSSGFVGYTLTAAERAATTGVRITVVPNDAARASSSDPLAPPVGSGVATSTATGARPIDLVWSLRNVVRVEDAAGRWVTSEHGYNDADPATIWNTVGVSGVHNGAPVAARPAQDNVTIVDQVPLVSIDKAASTHTIPVPFAGDVDPRDYPTVDFTITARNDSSARAPYIRVTDPMPCTDTTETECLQDPHEWDANPFDGVAYDPATNPFERLTVTKLRFSIANAGVDPAASTVTLWRLAADGSLSTEELSITAAEALPAARLTDVVGVSVLYQGTSPETTGGTIVTGAPLGLVLTTQLRVDERSTDEPVEPFTLSNYAFVQGHDPVLYDENEPYDSGFDGFDLVGGRLDVTAQKVIAPDSLLEKNRTEPVSVSLRATGGTSTVATQRVVISDTDADFWSRFGLVSLGDVALPAGSDRVRVDVQTGTDEWIEGTTAPAAVLPAVDPADVTGIRFVFTRADGDVFSHTAPPAGWSATAALTVRLLDTIRGTDEEIPFPSTVDNTVETSSSRTDDPEIYAEADAEASDSIALATGSYQLDVEKTPEGNVHTVFPGESIPWTLEFTNTGSGYLTIEDLVDTLPAELTFDQVEPTYTTSAGGSLSTDVAFAYDPDSRQLTFSWPDGGARMQPGETFRISLGIVLEPGLQVGQRATNGFVVTTAQELAACTNTSGNGQGVQAGLGATECGTTNYVQPTPGASLTTYKGVKGEIDGELVSGAVNVQSPNTRCITDPDGYVATPCAALTTVGATDEWKLQVVNSGTEGYTRLTLVEPLPTPGDRMLATGSSRASTFRPVFDGAFGIEQRMLPQGATLAWFVTTDAAACVGTGASTWPSDPTCNGNTWVPSTGYTGDWSDVTGLRVEIDFSGTPSKVMLPGQTLKLAYHTVNTPASAVEPERAPTDAPVDGEFAWNQFGAVANLSNGGTLQRAPVKAGVTLLGGPLDVTKAITGPGAAYAPDEFLVDVSCTVAGAPVDLGGDAVLELTGADDHRARIDGIPLGAECTVSEQGEVGEFGESARTGTPTTVSILSPLGTDGSAPEDQSVTITNEYALGGLSVTKAIDTVATVGAFGPFDFTVECATPLGRPVTLDPADASFSLESGATHTIAESIPVGSLCTVTETDADGADATSYSGDTVADNGDGSAVVTVAGEDDAVTVTNTFEAGTLSVLKTVLGDGAAEYGDGPFTAAVSCTYGGEVVFTDDALTIVPDVSTLVDAVFPVGTVCDVVEVAAGGANEHENPASVVITGPEDGEELGAVTAVVTNTFHTGPLDVVKERIGDGVAEFGAGPFAVQVTCTWAKDGQVLTVPIAGGGLLSLSEDNDYAASIDGIIVGAECSVVETDAGLATDSWTTPEDGTVTIVADAEGTETAAVVVTNRFDIGQLELSKTVETATAAPGDDVRYTITVRNTGQIVATDRTVTDVLPEGATFESSAPTAAVQGRTLTWTIDELGVGETATFSVVVSYPAAGTYVNHATVDNGVGPWRPVDVVDACGDDADACATVAVTDLAITGVDGWLVSLILAVLATIIGALVLLAARRRRLTEV